MVTIARNPPEFCGVGTDLPSCRNLLSEPLLLRGVHDALACEEGGRGVECHRLLPLLHPVEWEQLCLLCSRWCCWGLVVGCHDGM
eukprot:SAG31_NODE_6478_length_2002_cov_2.388862_1_plen_84_part_10